MFYEKKSKSTLPADIGNMQSSNGGSNFMQQYREQCRK